MTDWDGVADGGAAGYNLAGGAIDVKKGAMGLEFASFCVIHGI